MTPQSPQKPLLDDLPTVLSSLTCLQRGLCPIFSPRGSRSESHSIYYEVHGSPTTAAANISQHDGDVEVKDPGSPKRLRNNNKMVFISGWGATSLYWTPQVRWFGGGVPRLSGDEEEDFTALVFDNRGVGNSGYPRGPYTTGGMAEDVICLLDYLGWTADRELNIVATSLGGMIAQELVYRIPNRISSLLLSVTTPGGFICNNLPPWKGICKLMKISFPQDPINEGSAILDTLFTSNWLDSLAENDDKGRTNREIQNEELIIRLTSVKPQRFMGHISQMAAALTHHVSPSRLAFISERIPKIIIVTGVEDCIVAPKGSRRLFQGMTSNRDRNIDTMKGEQDLTRRVELVEWEDAGHGIHFQRESEFNELVMRGVKEGRNLNANLGSKEAAPADYLRNELL